MPPWVRLRTPLIHLDGMLACVGNLGASAEWRAFCAAQGFTARWQSPFGSGAL